jgi:hypothetical protein
MGKPSMSLQRKLKTALDETRLLILGAQVLFGFQFNGAFQELFEELPRSSRYLHCVALLLIMSTIALLIAPSMRHRLIDDGQDTNASLEATTFFAGAALLPLAFGLSLDVFLALQRIYGFVVGMASAGAFLVLALSCWYALELVLRRNDLMGRKEPEEPTPLSTRVDQLLTEARVIIPGAQALLGFQFAVTFTRAFEQIPPSSKLAHVGALFCLAIAVILLMAPAALHRLSFGGEDSPEFVKIGSAFVIAAPAPLALGIALDTFVASRRALDSSQGALILASLTLLVLFSLWYGYPVLKRQSVRRVS